MSTTAKESILSSLSTAYNGDRLADAGEIRVAYRTDPLNREEMLSLLLANLTSNKIGLYQFSSLPELLDSLANHLYSHKARRVAVAHSGLSSSQNTPPSSSAHLSLASLDLVEELRQRLVDTEVVDAAGLLPGELAPFDVGVTRCAALLARTGTLVLGGTDPGELAASLVPRVHFCLATDDQIFPGLEEWFAGPGRAARGNIVLASGPSRTVEIENQTVVGVHGPWKVTLFLLKNLPSAIARGTGGKSTNGQEAA